jgi:hypothetical protein
VDHLGPIAVTKPVPHDPDEPSDPDDLSKQDRDLRNRMRTGAQQLLGDTGLNCVSCHNFNGTSSDNRWIQYTCDTDHCQCDGFG